MGKLILNDMDAALKELTKLEKATDSNGEGPSVNQSLDSLLQTLHDAKASFLAGRSSEESLKQLAFVVEAKKKEIDERQKEIYNILSRLGKALDKVSTTRLGIYSD
jgi:hypothetical protein